MPDVMPLSPELSRSVSGLARALVAASRSWALYPPEHPAVRSAIDRLRTALAIASSGRALSFGVTPDTLLVEGVAVASEGPVADAARWLHQHDILQMTFAGDVPVDSLEALLALLSEDVQAVRSRGGPAESWRALHHGAVTITQIDFASVFEDRDVAQPARHKDDLWRSIVRSVVDRHKWLDEAAQKRLLQIAGDAVAIGELAHDVSAPSHAADGSPMLTSQAAAVVAAYRHLMSIVDLMEPGRRTEVMQNVAAATATLDSRLVLQMLTGGPDAQPDGGVVDVRARLASGFDDLKVAQLLATTLAIDGQASELLAGVFDTIAPDEPRKRRVLTLTKTLLGETSFGKTNQFHSIWTSMEELLLTYNEKPFVPARYKIELDDIGARAEVMAADVPDDLRQLIDTLGQDNVRRLSVTLLIDLLRMEGDAARAPGLARDVAALGEDLLFAGDYASARLVAKALATQAATAGAVTQPGSRVALDALVETVAFHETVDMLGDMTAESAALFAEICDAVGPAAADALRDLLDVDADTPARRRAADIIRRYGGRAATRLAPLLAHPHWYAVRNVAELLGQIGSAEAIALLQPLLRGPDARVMRAAVRALAGIRDPAAARAIHTVLRAATGGQRQAVVAALVEERDPRVIPVLACILEQSRPLGGEHELVVETLAALADVGGDDGVPHIVRVMRQRSWFARGKTRSLKRASLGALRRIGSPAAVKALADAAAGGDRMLRRLAREAARARG